MTTVDTPNRRNWRNGLTLIEILVSLAILATAMVVVLQALARGSYALALAQQRLRAYAFASEQMAGVELGLLQGIPPQPQGELRIGRNALDWRVDIAPSAQDPELELVTLTVGWRQGPHTYTSDVSTLMRLPTPSL